MAAKIAPENTKSGYASINSLEMYYEIHGEGQPLVLLHGALSETQSSFGKILPQLAKTYKVISVEQQAHGHTVDIDRPLSIEQMTKDTTALLGQLGVKTADFFGYSMGADVALHIAIRNPELVRKLVLASVSYNILGVYAEAVAGEESLKPEDLAGSVWETAYMKVAPNPKDWPNLVSKVKEMDQKVTDLPAEAIKSIKAPTLLIIGDSDIIRPEHAVEMFRLLDGGVAGDIAGLPRSQLAVLPGTTHVTLIDRADWLQSMILTFLNAPMPEIK